MSLLTGYLKDEEATKYLAQVFVGLLVAYPNTEKGLLFFLKGDLGAGKTFFTRSVIQEIIPEQMVKSPTYTLVESYELPINSELNIYKTVQHFDLYRLCSSEELEYLGIRELLSESFCSFIEWADKGTGVLPEKPDLEIAFEYQEKARTFAIKPYTERGRELVKKLTKKVGIKFDK